MTVATRVQLVTLVCSTARPLLVRRFVTRRRPARHLYRWVFASGVCGATAVNGAPPFPLVPTVGVGAQVGVGYYTYTALAQDAAGNQTATVTRVVVRDNTPATATSPAVPVTITGAFTASSFLNDDLSIRDYFYTVGFGGALTAPATITLAAAPTAVDAFNSATLTNTNFAINTSVNTFLGLQATTAGNVPNAYVANAAAFERAQPVRA